MSLLKQRLIHLWSHESAAPNPPRPWPILHPDRIFLTIGEPLKMRETVLLPGRYAFRPLDPEAERTSVQIFNEDQTMLVATLTAVSSR
jgi:hypothetical protein